MKTLYTWKTNKTENGYGWVVTKSVIRGTPNSKGRYSDDKIVKTGSMPTRARAKSASQKWCRYLRVSA